ncbi:MAG: c-type cytochrome [Caulobacteraceae bacterium]
MATVQAIAVPAGLLLAGVAAAQTTPKGDPAAGAAVFEDRCAMCHVAAGGGQGPSLAGVFGRRAGTAPGFHYTAALGASGLTWTAASLDRFLAGPGKVVPGTAMSVAVHDAGQRADLIAYLAGKGPRR